MSGHEDLEASTTMPFTARPFRRGACPAMIRRSRGSCVACGIGRVTSDIRRRRIPRGRERVNFGDQQYSAGNAGRRFRSISVTRVIAARLLTYHNEINGAT
jgi:hypothetical protein